MDIRLRALRAEVFKRWAQFRHLSADLPFLA